MIKAVIIDDIQEAVTVLQSDLETYCKNVVNMLLNCCKNV